MSQHYWDEALGMFVPEELQTTEGIQPTPFGKDYPRNQAALRRAENAAKLAAKREEQYEEWREQVRAELAEAQGDTFKEAAIRARYATPSWERGYAKSSYSNSQPPGKGQVYVIQDMESGLYKIGRTNNLKRRLKELGVGKTARLIQSKEVDNPAAVEKAAHRKYKHARLPQTEYFKLDTPPCL